jgi:hypothetical protein
MKRRRAVAIRTLTIGLLLLAASPAAAQTSATLAGRVEDTNGNVLPGVTVTATHVDTSATRAVITDAGGRFVLSGLPAGEYRLRAEIAGFRPLVHTGVRLTVAQEASITLLLELGVFEEITVAAGATPIETRSGALTFLVEERSIARCRSSSPNTTRVSPIFMRSTSGSRTSSGSFLARARSPVSGMPCSTGGKHRAS